MSKTIYLDNAATTKPTQQVIDDFVYASQNYWYNPSSIYQKAIDTRGLLEHTREQCAKSINAEPEEIIFTSGGSEGNSMVIKGIMSYYDDPVFFYTDLEHPSVINNLNNLRMYNRIKINVGKDGMIDPLELDNVMTLIGEGYNFVYVQMANNEIGTIQDIQSISEVAHRHHAKVIVDAVQAYMHIPIDVEKLGIDIMITSGHKFGALKGTGFVYIKKGNGLKINPLIEGGHQEIDMRAGTENVAGIYAMGNRVEYLSNHMESEHVRKISKKLESKIYEKCRDICNIHSNGAEDSKWRLPNNISITFHGKSATNIVTLLSGYNICVSAGSACSSGEPTPSRVLKTIGLSDEDAKSTVRITVSTDITDEDIDYFVEILVQILNSI